MRQTFTDITEKSRVLIGPYQSVRGERHGSFLIPFDGGFLSCIVASAELCQQENPGEPAWDHVSACFYPHGVGGPCVIPSWDAMCFLKKQFWREDEAVVQYHPADSDHINIHNHVLHLWRPADGVIPMPPKWMV